MPYSVPNSTVSDFLGYYQYVVAVEPLYIPMMLLVIWVIIFIATLKFTAPRAFITASFATTILAFMAGVMGMIAQKFVLLSMVATAGGLVWLILEQSRE